MATPIPGPVSSPHTPTTYPFSVGNRPSPRAPIEVLPEVIPEVIPEAIPETIPEAIPESIPETPAQHLPNPSIRRYLFETYLNPVVSRLRTLWDFLVFLSYVMFPGPRPAPRFNSNFWLSRNVFPSIFIAYNFLHYWFKWSFDYLGWLIDRVPKLLEWIYISIIIPAISVDYTIPEKNEMKKNGQWPPSCFWVRRGGSSAKFFTLYGLILPLLSAYVLSPFICNVWNKPVDTERHIHWRAPSLHPTALDRDPRAPYLGEVPLVWKAKNWWAVYVSPPSIGEDSWLATRRMGMKFRDDSEPSNGVLGLLSSKMPVVEKASRMRSFMSSWSAEHPSESAQGNREEEVGEAELELDLMPDSSSYLSRASSVLSSILSSRKSHQFKDGNTHTEDSDSGTYYGTEAQLTGQSTSRKEAMASRKPSGPITSKEKHNSRTLALIEKDIATYKPAKFTNFHIDEKASQCRYDELTITSADFYKTVLELRTSPADKICAGPKYFDETAPIPTQRCQNLDVELKGGLISMCGAAKIGVEITCRELGDILWWVMKSCRVGEKMGSGSIWLEGKKGSGRAAIIAKEAVI
ncbi:hypothetical protein BJ508DRAFT_334809 [Ascobolus immersus RN42]|uniref:Uncharacterized protein n=1 Tax=Ascobolus immersus RN42 TaxID=1160509 RepID=A0A3N4HJB8_ASCIM|nr:hypothetical protein BJ508DRAFT_334809 [Ascobolus immersus RN42]